MNAKIIYAAGIGIIVIGVIFYLSNYVYNSSNNSSPPSSNVNINNTKEQTPQNQYNGPSNVQNLSLSVNSVNFTSSKNIPNMKIDFNIHNPNKGTAILETLSYNIYYNNIRLSSGDIGSKPEGFVDSLESVFPIIGNQTISLKDTKPLSDQGKALFDTNGNFIPNKSNFSSSSSSLNLNSSTEGTNSSNNNAMNLNNKESQNHSYLINGTYSVTLNRGSETSSSEQQFSFHLPIK